MLRARARWLVPAIRLSAQFCCWAAEGYLLDGRLGTKPWLTFAGLLLGIVVGFYELIKVTRSA
jgi:F0F1-type ATP synthase assembly protein I